MGMKQINSSDPRLHSLNVQSALSEIVDHLQYDTVLVNAPRFEALLETSREVLKGLRKAFEDYDAASEKAWGREACK
jgi:hypothetical protein